jgi:chromosome segregation ATPase
MSGASVDRNALVENREPPAGALTNGHDGLLGMRDKIESAFGSDMPPKIFHSSFDAAIQQQTAAFHDLNARLERLESAEMMELRDAMREICEAVAGLAQETDRNAKTSEENVTSLTDALQAQVDSARERAEKMQAQSDANQSASEKILAEIQEALRNLDGSLRDRVENMQAHADSSIRELDTNLRGRSDSIQAQADATQRGNELVLSEIKQSLRALETNLAANNLRTDELSRNLVTMSNEILDVTKAALQDQNTRLHALDARDQELSRAMVIMKEDLGNATAALLRGQRARLEAAEKSITDIQTGNAQMTDRVTTLEAGTEEVQRRLGNMSHDITVLQAYDTKFNEQHETLQTFTDDLAREFKVVKGELAELHETAATVQAHQAVLEQSESLMADLKDRQTRTAMRLEAFVVRHDELVGEVRLARADIEENASLQRAGLKQAHELVERTAADLKDRQTGAAARIDTLIGQHEDVASMVRVMQTDVKEMGDNVKAQSSIQIDTDKAIAELKDRQARAVLRLDHHDSRQDAMAADARAIKAELEKATAATLTHQARLDDGDKIFAEFRERHTRASMRMDAMDTRHDTLAGEVKLARTDIGEHGAALNAHRAAIDLTEKAITELKDRQTRAAMRMDSMDVRHEEVSSNLNRTKTALEEKSVIVDQHSLILDDASKALTDLKDRQLRSATRIETMDAKLEETSVNLRATITDLAEKSEQVATHQMSLEQHAKTLGELKDRQSRSSLRIDNLDGRVEELSTDMGVAKAGLSALADTPNALRAHQVSLLAQEAAIGELKDKSMRAANRIEGLDSRQGEFANELGVVKAGLGALSETPTQLRSHQVSLEAAEAALEEMKERQTRAQGRIEGLSKGQEEFSGEMRVAQAGLSSLSDTPNLIRTLQSSLDQADKAIAELKDRHDRSASRIEAQASRQDEFLGELSTVKTGLTALSETPNQIRGLAASLDAADNSIAELKERQTRSAARLDAVDTRQDELAGDMTQVKTGLSALSDMPNLLRGVETALENAEKSINEIKDRNARTGARLEALGHRQQELSIDVSSLKTGLAALGETPNQLRTLTASLDESDKAITELRERGGRAQARIEMLDNRQGEFAGDLGIVKSGLNALSETPNILRGHDTLLDSADKGIAEIKDRHARAAARIETLAANLGDLTGKLEAQSEIGRVMDERLRENEKQIAKASDRERALAQLHARAADALRGPEAGG